MVTLIARGFRYREAAEELEISEKTLETHMRHAVDKLGVASRHEMTRVSPSRPASSSPVTSPDPTSG